MTSQYNSENIAIIVSNLAVGGGAERVATSLANHLPHATLVTFYSTQRSAYYFKGNHVSFNEPMRKSVKGKLLRAPGRIWRIRSFCKKNKISVAIAFLEEANFYLLFSKVLLRNKSKTVVAVRNDPRRKNKIYQWFIRHLYPFADKVVANSREMAQILKDEFRLKNVEVIYNHINLDEVRRAANEQLSVEETQWFDAADTVFLSVGRLLQQKGQWHLIRAFEKVRHTDPGARLAIFGAGPFEKELIMLIEQAGLKESVRLFGTRASIFPYLKRADWFVLSSLWEGLPNVVLESLAVGTPTISTDCATGPREILAPDVSIGETLSYPYETSYGVLVNRLSDEPVFLPVSDAPLDESEMQLAHVMEKAARGEYHTTEHPLTDFQVKTVLHRWHDLISELNSS